MRSEKFGFEGHGGHPLAGRLDLPSGRPRAAALFAHCFTYGKDIAAARRIAARLSAEGYAVLRFDFTGLGHSGGEFANTDFASNAGDLVAAAAAMDRRGLAPGLLIGHSLGGAAVLAAAGRIASARALVTIGAPFDPAHVLGHLGAAVDTIRAEGSAEIRLAGRPFRIGRAFVEDVAQADLAATIGGLRRALLVMHAPRDAVVGIDNAGQIFGAAKHPKSFVTLDDADHLITDPADADYAAGVIAAWAARYLDMAPPDPVAGSPEGVTRVTEADPAGFLQDILAGPHHLSADEPKAMGGSDLGPSPYQLLAAALGACTAMTMRMYARRKGWPVAGIEVDVTHDRVHSDDAAQGGRTNRFRRVLRLSGDLDADQRTRLHEIADRCPVHRTLEAGARVETTAEDPARAG
jgi:putative redox protein